MIEAIGTSSIFICLTAIGGFLSYMVTGWGVSTFPYSIGYVSIINFVLIACFSVPMASLGAKMAHRVPQKKLKIIFSVLVLYMALKMLGILPWGDWMSGDRKVGENFDSDKADSIFDKLKNVEGKIKPKREGKFDNIKDLMNEAQYLEKKGKLDEAAELYKQVIFALPDSQKAYEALINIYQKQGDVDKEKDILKKAISNCKKNDEFKKRLNEIE